MSMELNSSSLKSGGISPLDSASDPDEKEISDNDDDDRNHKHRRHNPRFQSLERDPLEQTLTQSNRKRNRPYENGQSDPQSHYNLNRDVFKRRLTGTDFSRHFGEYGSSRGSGGYIQRDSRFGSIDVASQMTHPGSVPLTMFTGRGLPLSNAQPWSGFGLIPTIPHGSVDAISSIGLPGIHGPQMNPSLNMGTQHQQCRDFEELGFCLRGDMCPMEHGVNHIVVEDVQSLSQFNLPVSFPSAQFPGTSAGSGFLSSAGVSSTLVNGRGEHSRTNESSVDEDAFAGAVDASGADVYDPDQPLWNNDAHETSSSFLGLQPYNLDETVCYVDADLSDRLVLGSGNVIGRQSTRSSVWGRLKNSKNNLEQMDKFDVRRKALKVPAKEIHEPANGSQENFLVGKLTNGALSVPKSKLAISTSKLQSDVGGLVRKSSQKAQRSLFVNCIPLKDNKRENLLSHFRKFGEVIDIFIPANSEHAFVQFSKKEEAEKALKAPDAVMGSRFIKLWWANRDIIVDNGVSSANNASINKVNDRVQYPGPKLAVLKPSRSSVTTSNDFNPDAVKSPKAAPPAHKKMESLELLKEQLRKKQEMLERKRTEFRQQLDKLARQASEKSEVPAGPAEKSEVLEIPNNALKGGNSQPSDISISMPSSEVVPAVKMIMENLVSQRNKVKSAGAVQDPPILKQPMHPMATSRRPSYVNRYKLDNRPTTFRIDAPLPSMLANVDVLKDHFSSFGELRNLEIENLYGEESPNDLSDSKAMINCSACVSFVTRHAAERAFSNAKFLNGHNLHFSWVTSSIPTISRSSGGSSSAFIGSSNIEVQSAEKSVNDDSHITLGTKESTSSPPKSSNEISYDSSRSRGEISSPAKKHSPSEVQSPERPTELHRLKADEPENRDPERRQEKGIGDDLKPEEGLRAS